MTEQKLLEAVADIAYYAGYKGFSTGDSRADVFEFIHWAQEFENQNQDKDWDKHDYITEIEDFAEAKIQEMKF